MDLMTATHSNISQEEFNNLVGNWSQSARHPQTERLFIDMRYQPMIELVNYLKENQFKPLHSFWRWCRFCERIYFVIVWNPPRTNNRNLNSQILTLLNHIYSKSLN